MTARRIIHLLWAPAAMAVAGCSSINCPLNNTTYLTCGFYQMQGKELSSGARDTVAQAVEVIDTMTVTALGTDSVLINRMVGASTFELPMSYAGDEDVYVISFENSGRDTMRIGHTNQPHYETPECGVNMFHTITKASSTHNVIDRVEVVKANVNYDGIENVKIYLK